MNNDRTNLKDYHGETIYAYDLTRYKQGLIPCKLNRPTFIVAFLPAEYFDNPKQEGLYSRFSNHPLNRYMRWRYGPTRWTYTRYYNKTH